jgi:hypothetical protein
MSLDTVLTLLGTALILWIGGVPVARLTWRSWGRPVWAWLSTVFAPPPAEVTSSAPRESPAPRPSDLQTDQTDGADNPTPAPALRPATLDTCKSLRAHGYSREDARRFLRGVDRTLDNNVWAQAAPAAPPPDDTILTPIAGRPTRARYYDDPALEYTAPPEGT